VIIKNNSGTTIATTIVNNDGTWSVTPGQNLTVGNYVFTVQSVLSNQIVTGNTIEVSIKAATNCDPVHNPPTIRPIASFTLACGESSRSIIMSGSGTPGATVTVVTNSGSL
jgi:hypothetical protein